MLLKRHKCLGTQGSSLMVPLHDMSLPDRLLVAQSILMFYEDRLLKMAQETETWRGFHCRIQMIRDMKRETKELKRIGQIMHSLTRLTRFSPNQDNQRCNDAWRWINTHIEDDITNTFIEHVHSRVAATRNFSKPNEIVHPLIRYACSLLHANRLGMVSASQRFSVLVDLRDRVVHTRAHLGVIRQIRATEYAEAPFNRLLECLTRWIQDAFTFVLVPTHSVLKQQ